jgi:hypothetical protein
VEVTPARTIIDEPVDGRVRSSTSLGESVAIRRRCCTSSLSECRRGLAQQASDRQHRLDDAAHVQIARAVRRSCADAKRRSADGDLISRDKIPMALIGLGRDPRV